MPPARDYYSAIAYAVSKLDTNTFSARLALFERAKQFLVQELRARRPPASEPEIVHECAALRAAIREVEAELYTTQTYLRRPQNMKFGGDRPRLPTIRVLLDNKNRVIAAFLIAGALGLFGVLLFLSAR